jgi:hypothetical protein
MRRPGWLALAAYVLIGVGGAVLINYPQTPTVASGYKLPTVHLDKQAAEFTVSHGLCSTGGLNPRRTDDRLQAGTSMACADGAGYKVVQFRLAARLYARRAVWLPWHRYSISLTTDAHNWQGGFEMLVNDVCHVGAGLAWYQVRWSGTMTWSHPTSGGRGTEHYSGRRTSSSRHDCGGHE